MNFDSSEEQRLLTDSVRRFLAKDYGFDRRRRIVASEEGWSAPAWASFAAMGLTGLPFAAEHGGFGGGAVDLMDVMEAFGEALVVEPYLATLTAGRVVAHSPRAGSLLPGVVAGRTKLAFAHSEIGARYELSAVSTVARKSGGAWILEGRKAAVIGAPMADKLVVSARVSGGAEAAEGIGLFIVDPEEVRLGPLETLDAMRAADVVLEGAPAEPLGGGLDRIEEAADFAAALACAEAVGAMKYACDATLEHLKTRRQFGVPIGTFQALQHRMVDMVIACEQAKSMACLACSKVDRPGEARERSRAVSAAKIKVADSARQIAHEAVQLHGGMGMTEELKISHTFRRLTALASRFGDADHHLARFAKLSD